MPPQNNVEEYGLSIQEKLRTSDLIALEEIRTIKIHELLYKVVCCNQDKWGLLMRGHCTLVVSAGKHTETGQIRKSKENRSTIKRERESQKKVT